MAFFGNGRGMAAGWRRYRWWNSVLAVWLISGMFLFAVPHVAGTFPKETDTPQSGRAYCRADSIYDGDTLSALCGPLRLKIRLLGIDAPEMGQQPYGAEARAALRGRLQGVFAADIRGTDRYGRTLAVLRDERGDVNEWLVREGYAVAYRGKDTPKAYFAAERAAKRAGRGVWRAAGHQQDPRTWRRYHL